MNASIASKARRGPGRTARRLLEWRLPTFRSVIRGALLLTLLWFLGGVAGLVLGVIVVVAGRAGVSPRVLMGVAGLLFAVVPLLILANGLPPAAFVSPRFVRDNIVAHWVAGAGVVLLTVGVLRMARRGAGAEHARGPRPGPDRDRVPGDWPEPDRV